MDLRTWWRLLVRNGFRVSPTRAPRALLVTGSAIVTSIFRVSTRGRSSRKRASAGHRDDPVFIVGHWRTGTTYLHDLLSVDPQFTYPTLSQIFLPHHPPWAVRLLSPLTRRLGHGKRPMDNVHVSEETPQEDEFAILLRGAPSPYELFIFPGAERNRQRLTTEGYTSAELSLRRRVIAEHVAAVLGGAPRRRPLLKSPTYTGQIDLLLDLFPGARFVHLVRHPEQLLPSTVWMVRALQHTQGLRRPDESRSERLVVEGLSLMYAAFRRGTAELSADRVTTVRYEDLVRDPERAVSGIYEQLGLGPVPEARLRDRIRERAAYVPNVHAITAEQKAAIRRDWSFYFEEYGYSNE